MIFWTICVGVPCCVGWEREREREREMVERWNVQIWSLLVVDPVKDL